MDYYCLPNLAGNRPLLEGNPAPATPRAKRFGARLFRALAGTAAPCRVGAHLQLRLFTGLLKSLQEGLELLVPAATNP